MQITDKLHARQIVSTFEIVNAKPIKAVADGFDHANRLSAATRNLAAPESALSEAVAAALMADRDPAADAEVQRVLTASQIANQGVMQGVDAIAYDRFKAVCQQHTDAIVKAWSVPFVVASATLATVHQRIGDVPLEDAATILAMGSDAAALWAQARAASKVIEAASAGWLALGEFTRSASNDPRYPVLRIAAVDYRTWNVQQLERRRVTAWEAVAARLNLSLPTMAEYRARIATIEAGEQRSRQAAEAQRQDRITGRDPELARRTAQLAGRSGMLA